MFTQRAVRRKSLQVQVQAKKMVTSRQAFLEKYQGVAVEVMGTKKRGQDNCTFTEVPMEAFMQHAENMFRTLITGLRKRTTDEAKEQEKRAEKERKTEDDMYKKEPAVLLKDLVGELVQQDMAEARPMETEATEDPRAKKVDEFAQALSGVATAKNRRCFRRRPGVSETAQAQPKTYTLRNPARTFWHVNQYYHTTALGNHRPTRAGRAPGGTRKRKDDQLVIAKMSPVSQLFLDVMQSATAQDWMWLLKFDVLRNLVRGATRDTFGAIALRVYRGMQKIYPNGETKLVGRGFPKHTL